MLQTAFRCRHRLGLANVDIMSSVASIECGNPTDTGGPCLLTVQATLTTSGGRTPRGLRPGRQIHAGVE